MRLGRRFLFESIPCFTYADFTSLPHSPNQSCTGVCNMAIITMLLYFVLPFHSLSFIQRLKIFIGELLKICKMYCWHHICPCWKLKSHILCLEIGLCWPCHAHKNKWIPSYCLILVPHRWFMKTSEWMWDIKPEASPSFNSYLSRPFG